MPEFTQEQIDSLIQEKVLEAKKGFFTEDDLNRKVTAEVDRRVESGIQKGILTQKQKWEQEYSERAKMTAEELAKKEYEEKVSVLSQKEIEIKRKDNKLEARELLSNASIPKAHYENFLNILVSEDETVTKSNVENFINMFNSTKTELETTLKSQMSNVPPPKSGNDKVVSKQDFDKMGYAQKMDFKSKFPELYKEFIK